MNSQLIQAGSDSLTVEAMKNQINLINHLLNEVMKEGVHYGTIDGIDKKVLFKLGAEKLSLLFKLSPHYERTQKDYENGHREYHIKCILTHYPTGEVHGEGLGVCSTLESKYRYRKAKITCPECGNHSVFKSKPEYGDGYYCNKRQGGCGAKFEANDERITSQKSGKVENPDLADSFNTVLKMAKKRAHIDAILTATAAGDLFEQEIIPVVRPQEPEQVEPPTNEQLHQLTELLASGVFIDEERSQIMATAEKYGREGFDALFGKVLFVYNERVKEVKE